jgi:hypothetical protein
MSDNAPVEAIIGRCAGAVKAPVLLVLLLAVVVLGDGYADARRLADEGRYVEAVAALEAYLESGESFSDQSRSRYESLLFLWRRETGAGEAALAELLRLPERSSVLEPAVEALAVELAENPRRAELFSAACEAHPGWRTVLEELGVRLLALRAADVAARLAGAYPSDARRVLRELADDPESAATALAAYGGDARRLDIPTWRLYLELVESARGATAALAEARARLELEPNRNDCRLEVSERLRGLGRPAAAFELWTGIDDSGDSRIPLERGECLYELGRVDEAVAAWRGLLTSSSYLTPGRVRQLADVLAGHGLTDEALELLENPPTGELSDYARRIVELRLGLGQRAAVAELLVRLLEVEPQQSWAVEELLGFGVRREWALQALEALGDRGGRLFTRLRLRLLLAPWAVEEPDGEAGPLEHPLRATRPRRFLADEARRALEELIEGWSSGEEEPRHLEDYAVELLGAAVEAGLAGDALVWARRLARLPGLDAGTREALLAAGYAPAAAAELPAAAGAVAADLSLAGAVPAVRWLAARHLLCGGEPRAALELLEELDPVEVSGLGSRRAALVEAHLRLGELERAAAVFGEPLDEVQPPRDADPLYQLARLKLLLAAQRPAADLEPAGAVATARLFVELHGDDPRAAELVEFILAASQLDADGDPEDFRRLCAAWAAEIRGDFSAGVELLRAAAAGGDELSRTAALRLARLLEADGRRREAREVLDGLLEDGGALTDQALALAAYLEADFLGEPAAAREHLARLLADHPHSALREYARRALGELLED